MRSYRPTGNVFQGNLWQQADSDMGQQPQGNPYGSPRRGGTRSGIGTPPANRPPAEDGRYGDNDRVNPRPARGGDGIMFAGGSPYSDERTGGYRPYLPGQAQPVQPPSQGSPYAPGHGGRVWQGGDFVTTDFIDADGNGIDDRYQTAPGTFPQRPRPPRGANSSPHFTGGSAYFDEPTGRYTDTPDYGPPRGSPRVNVPPVSYANDANGLTLGGSWGELAPPQPWGNGGEMLYQGGSPNWRDVEDTFSRPGINNPGVFYKSGMAQSIPSQSSGTSRQPRVKSPAGRQHWR
jgi:hypothetical protein